MPSTSVGPGCAAVNKANEVHAVLDSACRLWGRQTHTKEPRVRKQCILRTKHCKTYSKVLG